MNSDENHFKMLSTQIIQAKVQIQHSRFIEVTFYSALFPLQLVGFLWQTDREFKFRKGEVEICNANLYLLVTFKIPIPF